MKKLLNSELLRKEGRPQVIITDPPRAGMDAPVVAELLKSGAEKIIYVSCNPATQARDLALLDEGYRITMVQPVDMFPHTTHVECVVVLERKA
jgi:23S rRNA (uracil1939-C5)-methyltransferase